MRTVISKAVIAAAVVAACAGQGTSGPGRVGGQASPIGLQSPPEGSPVPPSAALATAKEGDSGGRKKAAPAPPRPGALIPFIVVPRFHLPEPSTIDRARLFAFDEAARDVYPLPGTGEGTLGPSFYGDRYVLFYRLEGGVYSYDTVSGTIFQFNDVNLAGSAFRPAISGDGRTMTFFADPPDVPPVKGLFGRDPTPFTKVYLYRDGVVGELAVINAVARQDGGIDRTKIAGNGQVIAFSTRQGGLYVYTIGTELALRVQRPPARDPAFSPDGTVLAWTERVGAVASHLYVTVVATRSEPLGEPAFESATQVIIPVGWSDTSPSRSVRQSSAASPPARRPEPGKIREEEPPPTPGSTPSVLEAARPLVFYRPLHPPIPLAEASLAVGPRIVSISASRERIQIVSYDENVGTFLWWRYVFAGDYLELLTALNLASFTSGAQVSDVAGD